MVFALSTVWDGVYTAEQATRGSAAYTTNCAICHRPDLSGGEGRRLVGTNFWESWGEDSLSSLFEVVSQRMPENRPGSLDQSTYLDIVAFILQRNELPAGTTPLTLEAVKTIQVVGKNGPQPVPNFALVRVVGCLAKRGDGDWLLTKSSEPARTRDPAPSKGSELERSTNAVLGNGVFELMDAYDQPAGQDGKRVEVKGLLMRGNPNKVNFSSFQVLNGGCSP
jgi:hypothetical protein